MSKAFVKGWEEILKARPCPTCGAGTGDMCQGKSTGPANRCKIRRKAMERANRPTEFDNWEEEPVQ